MRILLATAGSHGDVNPFIAIGRALRQRGHEATLLANPYYQGQIEEAGVEFAPLHAEVQDLTRLAEEYPDVMHPRKGSQVVIEVLIKTSVRQAYPRVLELACTRGFDAVVHHHILPSAGWAAGKIGARAIPVVLAPMLWMSSGDLFTPVEWAPVHPGPLFRWFVRTMGPWAVRRMMDRPVDEIRREFNLPSGTPLYYDTTCGGSPNLGMWSPHLRGPCEGDPPGGVICGFPWHDRHGAQEALPDDVERFLQDGPPPMLFSLGTAAVHVAGDFYEVAAEACRMLSRRGLLLVGPKRTPPTNLPAGTRAFEYVPFSAVMPRCAANIHHGGIGSTGQGLRAGRPTVVIPHAHDQFDNAARVKRLGISETLPRGKVTPKRLAAAIDRMLTNPVASTRAAEIGALVCKENGAARAAVEIERTR